MCVSVHDDILSCMLQEKLNIGKMMPGFLLQDQQPNIEEVDQASVQKAMGHHVV